MMRTTLAILIGGSLLAACNAGSGRQETVGEATALAAVDTLAADAEELQPIADYDTAEWAEVSRLAPEIVLDLKYATADNFVKEQMYDCGRCFLRPEVAAAVARVQRKMVQKGLGLKMLDCYRPRPIQQKLWDKVPDPRYVADPAEGSMHNRGAAVDLTIVDLSTGRELDMGTPYDFFGPEAHPSYQDLPEKVLANRKLLRDAMLEEGFQPITTEWWHFSLTGKNYALSDMLWKCY
ncbi:M15 family metallopeptidase [Phaeodactylibacter luteus]|uniref:M15 family metallopeptidase n=1 Tax=Phaeodactylibacter luteus TaxID=1564516 RepID=UPI001FE7EE80|nr:M15 family metallopeptidase [Phaeodactylibacter luteus]